MELQILMINKVNNVFILTRHDSHFGLVKSALTNKNVFVEKPLVIDRVQLEKVIEIYNKNNSNLW